MCRMEGKGRKSMHEEKGMGVRMGAPVWAVPAAEVVATVGAIPAGVIVPVEFRS